MFAIVSTPEGYVPTHNNAFNHPQFLVSPQSSMLNLTDFLINDIRELGSDFRQGDELLPAGRLLDKRAMVAAAAVALLVSLGVWRWQTAQLSPAGAAPGRCRQTPCSEP